MVLTHFFHLLLYKKLYFSFVTFMVTNLFPCAISVSINKSNFTCFISLFATCNCVLYDSVC